MNIDKKERIAIVIHLHYTSTLTVIAQAINRSALKNSDVFITLTPLAAKSKKQVKALFPSATIRAYQNRGRDIKPFLDAINEFDLTKKYDFILKLHGKKTIAMPEYGAFWLVDSLVKLLPNSQRQTDFLINELKKTSIIGPSKQLFRYDHKIDNNHNELIKILKRMKLSWSNKDDLFFFGGSMLWFNAKFLGKFYNKTFRNDLFPIENGQFDGTYAHAVERSFSVVPIFAYKTPPLVINCAEDTIRVMQNIDISYDGLIREYEEFSSRIQMVQSGGQNYFYDYLDLRNQSRINNVKAEISRKTFVADNEYAQLREAAQELSIIKKSTIYRILSKLHSLILRSDD